MHKFAEKIIHRIKKSVAIYLDRAETEARNDFNGGEQRLNLDDVIFISGFARGGTTWLRKALSHHPDIAEIRSEINFNNQLSKRRLNAQNIQRLLLDRLGDIEGDYKKIAFKAPANTLVLNKMAKILPNSKFIFILRDPRDSYNSHLCGNQEWLTAGSNATIDGCMKTKEIYLKKYIKASKHPNVFMIKYEDLHQSFPSTYQKICDFAGVKHSLGLLKDAMLQSSFEAQTGRAHISDPNVGARKGVVGDWVNNFSSEDINWFKKKPFWVKNFKKFEYNWDTPSYKVLLDTFKTHSIDVTVIHCLDDINKKYDVFSLKNRLKTDQTEGITSYYALPLSPNDVDDEIKRTFLDDTKIRNEIKFIFLLREESDVSQTSSAIEEYKEKGIQISGIAYLQAEILYKKDTYPKLGVETVNLPEFQFIEEDTMLKMENIPAEANALNLESFSVLSHQTVAFITNSSYYSENDLYTLAFRTKF